MKERGIIMSGSNPMLILSDAKIETRRLFNPQPALVHNTSDRDSFPAFTKFADGHASITYTMGEKETHRCPYQVGQRLWVRERHSITKAKRVSGGLYELTGFYFCDSFRFKIVLTAAESKKFRRRKRKSGSVPSIFMFRSLSRIDLKVTKTSGERLQDITDKGARAEGFGLGCNVKSEKWGRYMSAGQYAYVTLFEKLHGEGTWRANPWVWVYGFKRL